MIKTSVPCAETKGREWYVTIIHGTLTTTIIDRNIAINKIHMRSSVFFDRLCIWIGDLELTGIPISIPLLSYHIT